MRFIQTDKVRSKYDTYELIQTLMQMEYDDDMTILANQGRLQTEIEAPYARKDRNKINKAFKQMV